jgi:hypothetical protein
MSGPVIGWGPRARDVSCRIALVCLVASLVLAAGCAQAPKKMAPPPAPVASPPPPPKPPPKPSPMPSPPKAAVVPPVMQHRWLPIDTDPSEAWPHPRFGMYTYVIYAGPTAESPKADARANEAARRFRRLLSAIGDEGKAGAKTKLAERTVTNLFVVPQPRHAARLDASLYDRELARRSRLFFAAALEKSELRARMNTDREGPFLLSTRVPVGEIAREGGATFDIDTKQPILLVDLTGQPDRMVAEVVAEFKRHAETPGALSGVKSLEPFRISLIAALLRLDQAIPFVGTALAGTTQLLGWKGSDQSAGDSAKP